jgi:hypothetical protein
MKRRRKARISEFELMRLRGTLPYGMWLEKDGSIVLFNRSYTPIWRRSPGVDGVTTAIPGPILPDVKNWINWIKQVHLFDDGSAPWHHAAVREFLEEEVLACWFDVGSAP